MKPAVTLATRRLIALARTTIRDGEQFGACHLVSAAIERAWGWRMASGCYDYSGNRPGKALDREVLTAVGKVTDASPFVPSLGGWRFDHEAHRWTVLPDGRILDGTADQFVGYKTTRRRGVHILSARHRSRPRYIEYCDCSVDTWGYNVQDELELQIGEYDTEIEEMADLLRKYRDDPVDSLDEIAYYQRVSQIRQCASQIRNRP